jgi:hypothetical protein
VTIAPTIGSDDGRALTRNAASEAIRWADPDLAAPADRRDRVIDHLPRHESGQVSADPRSRRRRTLRPDHHALPFSECDDAGGAGEWQVHA